MGKSTNKERIAKLEEQSKFADKERTKSDAEFKERVTRCLNTFQNINKRLDIINTEQGETRDAVKDLKREMSGVRDDLKDYIKQRVSAPMSGRDKAILYGTAITAFFTFLSVIIPALLNTLS